MSEDDYRALILLVEERLTSVGASNVADEANYLMDDGGGSKILMPPQKHLIEMLEGFERYLAVRDKNTLIEGLIGIQQAVEGDFIKQAFMQRPVSGVRRDDIDLMNAPDLKKLREAVRTLANKLKNEGRLLHE